MDFNDEDETGYKIKCKQQYISLSYLQLCLLLINIKYSSQRNIKNHESKYKDDKYKQQSLGFTPIWIFPSLSMGHNFERRKQLYCNSKRSQMKYEVRRRMSFHKIKISASPFRLANAGFFATEDGDETMCFSCGVCYSRWTRYNDVFKVHLILSPNCLHANNCDANNVPIVTFKWPGAETVQPSTPEVHLGNVPTDATRPNVFPQRSLRAEGPAAVQNQLPENPEYERGNRRRLGFRQPVDTVQETGVPGASVSNARGPVDNQVHRQVKHSSYESPFSRLQSFLHRAWTFSLTKPVEDLAAAGFFYAGFGDSVICFYCGTGLRSWAESDDPWEEHVRCSPSCDYILEQKGHRFVSETQKRISIKLKREADKLTTKQDNIQRSDTGTETCRQAFAQGYSRDAITKHVLAIVDSHGLAAVTATRLLERLEQEEN